MLEEKLIQYFEIFGDRFPMIPLAWGRTEDETISLIERCLKEHKDVYALGLVSDDIDIDY